MILDPNQETLFTRIESLERIGLSLLSSRLSADEIFKIYSKSLDPEVRYCADGLVALIKHASGVPEEQRQAFLQRMASLLHWVANIKESTAIYGLHAIVAWISTLSGEARGLLASPAAVYRPKVERAFSHLERLLVADESVRNTWSASFRGTGERGVEQLGAAHLLLHGVWAFKAHGAGARTDLVLGGELDADLVSRTGSFLVLTEWKVADAANFKVQKDQAIRQADAYGAGLLAAWELLSPRFIVIVTEKHVEPNVSEIFNGNEYRVLCLPINRPTPSRR